MTRFDDDQPEPDTDARYQLRWLDLHSVPDARLRIMRRLGTCPDGCPRNQLLPERADGAAGDWPNRAPSCSTRQSVHFDIHQQGRRSPGINPTGKPAEGERV